MNFALTCLCSLTLHTHLHVIMSNTYTQLYIHIVFAVKYRLALINPRWEERLHKYMIGIIDNNGHRVLAINSAYDHIHILIGLNPHQSISELLKDLKGDSSKFINRQKLTTRRFRWQEGYGAFSHSRSQVDHVVRYILNQKEKHNRQSFVKEYQEILRHFDIDFDQRYIFKEPEG